MTHSFIEEFRKPCFYLICLSTALFCRTLAYCFPVSDYPRLKNLFHNLEWIHNEPLNQQSLYNVSFAGSVKINMIVCEGHTAHKRF